MLPQDPGGAPFWAAKAGASEIEELRFPKFEYYLDESDPDVVILRRQDGAFVAAFSATGATPISVGALMLMHLAAFLVSVGMLTRLVPPS